MARMARMDVRRKIRDVHRHVGDKIVAERVADAARRGIDTGASRSASGSYPGRGEPKTMTASGGRPAAASAGPREN
jgi:hypothetical protein